MNHHTRITLALVGSVTLMGLALSALAIEDVETRSVEARQPADNTGRNTRDSQGTTPTADTQSNAPDDLEVTRRIREALVKNDSLSTSAHNVKIVTQDGRVTLRGPVVSEKERSAVVATAEKIAGVKHVDNQLEIASR